jgi:hypothetical protein
MSLLRQFVYVLAERGDTVRCSRARASGRRFASIRGSLPLRRSQKNPRASGRGSIKDRCGPRWPRPKKIGSLGVPVQFDFICRLLDPRRISDGRYTPNSDRLLRCLEMSRWANFCRKHPQQKLQAISPSANPEVGQRPACWGVIFCPISRRAWPIGD